MSDTEATTSPPWKPLPKMQRRIAGVLIEKAKTTPDQYPLSLNALVNGCNQKSNRDPQMNLQDHQVETALVELRQLGVAGEVQGNSRVAKYRHYMKEWLGVSGPEMAVMAELLLRGAQSIGELRGRANRMTQNEIPDVAALRPVLSSLIEKKLVIALTPAGRGQTVTHGLYQENELAALFEKFGTPPGGAAVGDVEQVSRPVREEPAAEQQNPTPVAVATEASDPSGDLSHEVRQLREEVERLKREVEDLWKNVN